MQRVEKTEIESTKTSSRSEHDDTTSHLDTRIAIIYRCNINLIMYIIFKNKHYITVDVQFHQTYSFHHSEVHCLFIRKSEL